MSSERTLPTAATNERPRLQRANAAALGIPASIPPTRIVHLGLGNFHRAHQAWYTAHADDAADWGIAAFTGRSPAAASVLARQDGLYTLVERGPSGDRDEVVTSLVATFDGADIGRLLALFESPAVTLVTITVTEVGYRLLPDGTPDPADDLLTGDLAALRGAVAAGASLRYLAPVTMLGRLLAGLEARRRAGGPALAVVPCDNVPANGSYLRTGASRAAASVSSKLREWVDANVSFVSTSVDRITPRVGSDEREQLNARLRWIDASPVVTEPFHDWVLAGAFPAERPRWESAGARFVDDIEPWERRKLWLLNGAHTLLSFAGPVLGHRTVAAAIADPRLRSAVELLWDDACRQLSPDLDLQAYRVALLERFSNPRIEHRLAQIAEDGTHKLSLRIVPVCAAELAAGRIPVGGAFAVAAWIVSDRERVADVRRALLALSPTLAVAEFTTAVEQAIRQLAVS